MAVAGFRLRFAITLLVVRILRRLGFIGRFLLRILLIVRWLLLLNKVFQGLAAGFDLTGSLQCRLIGGINLMGGAEVGFGLRPAQLRSRNPAGERPRHRAGTAVCRIVNRIALDRKLASGARRAASNWSCAAAKS